MKVFSEKDPLIQALTGRLISSHPFDTILAISGDHSRFRVINLDVYQAPR